MSNDPIVAGWDGTERGRDALALAALLARERGAKVLVAHAFLLWPSSDPLPDEYTDELRKAALEQTERIPRELLDGVEAEGRAVPAQSPGRGLHDLAEREGAQAVVLGSTHRGPLGRVVPGSVAERFLHGAPCPVAIAPAGYADSPAQHLKTVAVAFEASDESRAAVRAAAEWALAAKAELRIIAVVGREAYAVFGAGPMVSEDLSGLHRKQVARELEAVRKELPAELHVEERVLEGVPAGEILAEAAKGVDLLVMGSRAYGPVRRVLLGSVSGEVVRNSPCPVVVVPRTAASPGADPHAEAASSAKAGAAASG